MSRRRVLFLCTGNSARSQMGEALLRKLAGDRFEVHSAGLEPKGVHPLTVDALKEEGIDISDAESTNLRDYLGRVQFDDLISVCSHAESHCPDFPGVKRRYHWPFDDPAAATGSRDEQLAEFRRVRDEIKARLQAWLANPDLGLKA
ncbi:MAG: arsenate reductase ArsC [Planctomycetes bacterium]|nr:arsenate reductase ArsC [Planctomycetota bacterium]